ncbi:uncharacterized protein LOC126263340 [Schistocerca nitens]|uniref:uncharacterized protein LOC126263340 n=1 Tax=Schistocerca nitens TaxID=7011 RepID=UPI0021175EC2|nr:uncharacterized protein LOC126263340 [Schistocerca nitens]
MSSACLGSDPRSSWERSISAWVGPRARAVPRRVQPAAPSFPPPLGSSWRSPPPLPAPPPACPALICNSRQPASRAQQPGPGLAACRPRAAPPAAICRERREAGHTTSPAAPRGVWPPPPPPPPPPPRHSAINIYFRVHASGSSGERRRVRWIPQRWVAGRAAAVARAAAMARAGVRRPAWCLPSASPMNARRSPVGGYSTPRGPPVAEGSAGEAQHDWNGELAAPGPSSAARHHTDDDNNTPRHAPRALLSGDALALPGCAPTWPTTMTSLRVQTRSPHRYSTPPASAGFIRPVQQQYSQFLTELGPAPTDLTDALDEWLSTSYLVLCVYSDC